MNFSKCLGKRCVKRSNEIFSFYSPKSCEPAADLQKWQELTAFIITTVSSCPVTYFMSSNYLSFCGHLQDLR